MISDVLAEAVQEIDRYLHHPGFQNAYTGELRVQIVQVRDDMNRLRITLDTPPER